jgi:hypothetical protein
MVVNDSVERTRRRARPTIVGAVMTAAIVAHSGRRVRANVERSKATESGR